MKEIHPQNHEKLGFPMLRTFILLILANFALTAEGKPESKSLATIIYEKAVDDNCKDAENAYMVYREALDIANQKVLEALEIAKSDLNDPKKGNESISERVKALDELERWIVGLNNGALEARVLSRASGDLFDHSPLDATRESNLLERDWKFTYNIPLGFRMVRFSKGGIISIGKNRFENSWRLTNKTLELLNIQGKVHSRFAWKINKWISILNDGDKINQYNQEITLP